MTDNVNRPAHYAEGWSNGAEVIDITEHLNFNRGNAVKYISRAGKKSALSEVEDLQKAQWYLSREIERLTDRSEAEPAYQVVPGPLPQEFWDDIDQSIVEAQEKRERDRTSRPLLPRVWESIKDIPEGVVARDSEAGWFWKVSGPESSSSTNGKSWSDFSEFRPSEDRYGPFTEVLDNEPEGSK